MRVRDAMHADVEHLLAQQAEIAEVRSSFAAFRQSTVVNYASKYSVIRLYSSHQLGSYYGWFRLTPSL